MDRKIFEDGVEELQLSFSKMEMTREKAEVWYKYSKNLSEREWEEKIGGCIRHCNKNSPVLADILEDKGDEYSGPKIRKV